jgi:hypothetical protein
MKIWLSILIACVMTLAHIAAAPTAVGGQVLGQVRGQQLPHRDYYVGFADLHEGEFRSALRRFNSAFRSAFRVGDARYLDSVCILTMMGECHYRVGDHQTALQMYNDALTLYLGLEGQRWQANIRLPAVIQTDTNAVQRARVTWGKSQRNAQIANVPDTISVVRKQLANGIALENGGVFDPSELRQVNVVEVLRCTALAIHRRRQISGVTGRYDPFSKRLMDGLKKSSAGNGTLMGALNGVVYGMALSAIGEQRKAAAILISALQIRGGSDHPLTPLALAELAHLSIANQQPAAALQQALEATYAGAYFQQPDVVEEGFGLATKAHLMTQRSVLPALSPALVWAGRERTQMLEASLAVFIAECFSEAGDAGASARALGQAGKLMTNRNNISQTLLAPKLHYLTAVNRFLRGDSRGGRSSLKVALEGLAAKSPAMFRLQLADKLAINQSLTEKQADLLYTKLLQDPSALLWKTEPMDAIAFLLTPHVSAMERWFEILINRKQIDRAVEVADQIRRHRFYAELPLGGRLLSLRWVLQGDSQFLQPDALKQRQSLLTRYSGYRDLLNQSTVLQNNLDALPLQPDANSADEKTQRQTMAQLAEIYSRQEALIAGMALRREPAEMAFPPMGNASSVQGFVLPGQMVFSALQTPAGYHIFFFDDQRAKYLGLVDALALKKGIGGVLAAMGVAANYADPQLLASDAWRDAIWEFQENLFEDIPLDDLAKADELIVIPDGLLWYVPFEAFLVGDQGKEVPLIETAKIRYCPTLFLSFANPASNGEIEFTGVVTGSMYPKTDSTFADQAFTEVLEKEIQAKDLSTSSSQEIPSQQLARRLDQLVGLNEVSTQNGAFGLQPMRVDGGRKNSQDQATLLDWMSVPLQSPDHVVMPGLNSIGGTGGLARPDGREMFFAATSIMAAGGRTALLSRWNSGGQTQANFAARYARYAAAMPVTTALQNAVRQTRLGKIDLAKEPRLKTDPNAPELTAEAPFFWANPILVSYADQRVADPAVIKELEQAIADAAQPPPQSDPPKQDLAGEQPPGQSADVVAQTPAAEDQAEEDSDDQGGAVWTIGGKKP